eukprot:g18024.t1
MNATRNPSRYPARNSLAWGEELSGSAISRGRCRAFTAGDLGDRGRPGWRDARTARLVDAGPLPPQARDERRAAFREEENFVGL